MVGRSEGAAKNSPIDETPGKVVINIIYIRYDLVDKMYLIFIYRRP